MCIFTDVQNNNNNNNNQYWTNRTESRQNVHDRNRTFLDSTAENKILTNIFSAEKKWSQRLVTRETSSVQLKSTEQRDSTNVTYSND